MPRGRRAMGRARRPSARSRRRKAGARGYRPMGTRGGYHQGKVASGRTNNRAWRQRGRRR